MMGLGNLWGILFSLLLGPAKLEASRTSFSEESCRSFLCCLKESLLLCALSLIPVTFLGHPVILVLGESE